MDVKIVEYQEIHAKTIKTRLGEHIDIKERDTSEFVGNNMSYSVLDPDDEVLAIFGVLSEGRNAMSWLVLSRFFLRYSRQVTDSIKFMIDVLSARGDHDLLMGSAPLNCDRCQRWISKHLGFERVDHVFQVDGQDNYLYKRSL